MQRIQIVGPHLEAAGGVASYYNALLPHLRASASFDVRYAALGSGTGGRRWHALTDQWRVRSILDSTRPDIVHLNPSLGYKSFIRDALVVRAAKRRGLRVLVFFRGWSAAMARQIDGPLGGLFSASYARADGFIVLAGEFERRLRAWGVRRPIFRGTTAVSDGLIDQAAVRRRWGATAAGDGRVGILYLSRLEPDKGPLQTLQAVERLLRAGLPVSLTIAGDGAAAPALAGYLRQRPGLAEHVSIPGHVGGEAKAELLRRHDVFCLPTRYGEGMPNAVLEAMAFGMAVVSSPAGGLRDFFDAGRMGALVPACEADPLARALERLVSDRAGLVAMGRFNFDYAQRNFYASKVAAQLLSIYRSVLGTTEAAQAPPVVPERYCG